MPENRPHIEEDWWTPDQVELANDVSRIWEKKLFVSQPGYWILQPGVRALARLAPGEEMPEGATPEPGAWDHEHCALCWNKITEKGGDFQDRYTDGKDSRDASAFFLWYFTESCSHRPSSQQISSK